MDNSSSININNMSDVAVSQSNSVDLPFLSQEATQSLNSDGVNVVPMLAQQNRSLQDMVKNCHNELNNLREFSKIERDTYEQRIQELQEEIKENKKMSTNISSNDIVNPVANEVSCRHDIDRLSHNLQNVLACLWQESESSSSKVVNSTKSSNKRNFEGDFNLLRSYYVDYLRKDSKEQAIILKEASKVISIVDEKDFSFDRLKTDS